MSVQKVQTAVVKEIAPSEMLNVMDIVDEMRHQEDYLQKHYDSLLSNDVLKEQLRTVYAQHSIVVDDSTLMQAVQKYREKQFVLPAVKDGLSKSIATLYVTRTKWQKKFALSVMGVLVAASFAAGSYVSYESYKRSEAQSQLENAKSKMQEQLSTVVSKKEQLKADIKNINSSLDVLMSGSKTAAWSGGHVAAQVQEQKTLVLGLENFINSLALSSSDVEGYKQVLVSANSIEQVVNNNSVEQVSKKLSTAQNELSKIIEKNSKLSALIATESLWNNLEKSADVRFKEGAQWRGATVKMQTSLSAGDVESAQVVLEQTKNNLVNETKWLSLDQRMTVAKNKSKSFDVLAQELMGEQFNVAQSLREKGDIKSYEVLLGEIEKQVDEAALDLTFTVVSRQGVKSGVERTANISAHAAKKYYVIVEALDSMGVAQSVRVKNAENGSYQSVKMFGVEVSKDVYEQVKRDKMDDGIIQKAIVAKKPAGSLTWKEVGGFNYLTGRITQW